MQAVIMIGTVWFVVRSVLQYFADGTALIDYGSGAPARVSLRDITFA